MITLSSTCSHSIWTLSSQSIFSRKKYRNIDNAFAFYSCGARVSRSIKRNNKHPPNFRRKRQHTASDGCFSQSEETLPLPAASFLWLGVYLCAYFHEDTVKTILFRSCVEPANFILFPTTEAMNRNTSINHGLAAVGMFFYGESGVLADDGGDRNPD